MKIKRPEGTVIVPVNGKKYVYKITDKRYLKEKKYNEDKRVCIGRMEDDIFMIPNARCREMFPELLVQEDAQAPVPECSDVLKVGAYIAIDRVLEQTGLGEIIDNVYEGDSDMIKDVAAYMINSEDSVMQHFPSYEFEHPLFMPYQVNDSSVCEMLKRHTIAEHDRFLAEWNDIHAEKDGIYISYDSTNMNSAATGIEMLEFGHSKDDDSEFPQVNVSLAFDQDDATPLFYEIYPGSIIDNSQCSVMVEKARKYGYKKIGFILDRGYFSGENIRYFEKNGFEFIMMAKGNAKFLKPVMKAIKIHHKLAPSLYIDEYDVFGTTVKKKLYEKDTRERYIHVYYDEVRGAEQRMSVIRRFSVYDKELAKMCEKKLTRKHNLKKYEKYYNMQFISDYLVSFRRKDREIEKELEKCGYFVIITSEEMTAQEAIAKYRNRDSTEKQFMTEKSFLGGDTWRVHSDESLESKQLTSFVALIVRNEIFKSVSGLRAKDRKRYTVPAVIRELDRIIMTRDRNGKFSMRYALTATQKMILKQLEIDQAYVKKMAGKIAKKYDSREPLVIN